MILLFVGDEIRGNILEIYSEQNQDCEVEFTGLETNIKNIAIVALKRPYDAIVYDIDMFINDPETIVSEITKIHRVNGTRIIIYASGMNTESAIILECADNGIKELYLLTL